MSNMFAADVVTKSRTFEHRPIPARIGTLNFTGEVFVYHSKRYAKYTCDCGFSNQMEAYKIPSAEARAAAGQRVACGRWCKGKSAGE